MQSSSFQTDSLENMDNLKLLQLKYVQLTGSYENFSEHLRWICWIGFHLRTIPCDLFMGNLVALDMSCSCLEVFEPPMVGYSVSSFHHLVFWLIFMVVVWWSLCVCALFTDTFVTGSSIAHFLHMCIVNSWYFCNRFFNHYRF